MRPYTPTSEEASLAIKVTSLLGLDFAGVDLLFGPKGPLICEINSNAHFKNIDECTGSNVANSIIHHIINTQKRTYE